jgi:anti-sigma B factor antagonist
MNPTSAKLSVLIGEKFACIKISGRANFTSSLDFKSVVEKLGDKGCKLFVLELSECTLMDSTFLGLLAGFGLKMRGAPKDCCDRSMILFNPTARITELLENLGVLDLFCINHGSVDLPQGAETVVPTLEPHGREEVARACLEAHQTLSSLSPEYAARFKDVTQFLAEDLKKIKQAEAE